MFEIRMNLYDLIIRFSAICVRTSDVGFRSGVKERGFRIIFFLIIIHFLNDLQLWPKVLAVN